MALAVAEATLMNSVSFVTSCKIICCKYCRWSQWRNRLHAIRTISATRKRKFWRVLSTWRWTMWYSGSMLGIQKVKAKPNWAIWMTQPYRPVRRRQHTHWLCYALKTNVGTVSRSSCDAARHWTKGRLRCESNITMCPAISSKANQNEMSWSFGCNLVKLYTWKWWQNRQESHSIWRKPNWTWRTAVATRCEYTLSFWVLSEYNSNLFSFSLSGSEIAGRLWTPHSGCILWFSNALRSLRWAQRSVAHFHATFAWNRRQQGGSHPICVWLARPERGECKMPREQLQILRIVQMAPEELIPKQQPFVSF